MTDHVRRVRAVAAGALIILFLASASACAPTPAASGVDIAALDAFRGPDGLFHDRDVRGLDGSPMPQGSVEEGLRTTAAVLRLFETSGIQPHLSPEAAVTIDRVSSRLIAAGSVETEGGHDLILGAARVCALVGRQTQPCTDVRRAARELLESPVVIAGAQGPATAAHLIEAASDLGMRRDSFGASLADAFAQGDRDPCVESSAIRHDVRVDERLPLEGAAEPRALTDRVLASLAEGDLDTAFCLSGVVAATAGATPERDEDWLQVPFAEAVRDGFNRTDDGLYLGADRGRGRIETTRMLSQISFDLSVELT